MIETKRFHCNDCDYYWELTTKNFNSHICPICKSTKVHRATGQLRYSRKARPKVRRSYSTAIRR